ncbi:MAG: SPOR domain-containing protein [Gallionella sp.]
MRKFETGNTVLGILLGMLGGIALTSALAWFIFKAPPAFVDRNQVVARDLKLPANTVEELLAAQRRTGNPDAAITLNGYRVRTNSRHEIFVAPITPPGVKPQPEVQVVRRMPVNGVVPVNGISNKQNFEFYEILEQRHHPVIPAPVVPGAIVENQGSARITIYPAERPAPILADAPDQPLLTISPAANRNSVENLPMSGQKPLVANTVDRVMSYRTASQVESRVPPKKPAPVESKMTFLGVDFFTQYAEAVKLQEKLLASGLAVQLKEEKVLNKRAGYKVFVGPYTDKNSLNSAKAKLQQLGFTARAQNQ